MLSNLFLTDREEDFSIPFFFSIQKKIKKNKKRERQREKEKKLNVKKIKIKTFKEERNNEVS